MKMTLRWFGSKHDSVTLKQIRQIPGVTGVITTLYDIPAGKVWPIENILKLKEEVEASGLKIEGIESVNIHDSIKIGLPEREQFIENYIETLENLGKAGINMVCYNFMPVFDWTRSDLAKMRLDGSTVLSYDQALIDEIDPVKMFEQIDKNSNGFVMPGWEPERLEYVKELFEKYKDVNEEKLFNNLVYFLNKIRPVCEKYNIMMAIHPDDPAWPVFDLPRIINNKENILKLLNTVDAKFNGLTLCTGSLGSNPNNDICDIIRSAKGRIHFAHVRNIIHLAPGKFDEAAHLSKDGSLDMYEIMSALYEIGFDGPVRPDHGRAIWGEVAMPGYGLYDRALGATYLNGLIEAIEKAGKSKLIKSKAIKPKHKDIKHKEENHFILRQEELNNRLLWEESGFELPKFDRNKMIKDTKENPEWIHFGAGNIFRAFPAAVCQDLLNSGILKTGIVVAEGYDYEIIEKGYKKFDDLSLLVTLKADGSLEKKVIGSIAESLCVDTNNLDDWNRLKDIFKSPTLKMGSFTITEKGYSLKDGKDEFLKDVWDDFNNGPSLVTSYMGKLVALCYERFKYGRLPLTLVSMDNCSHNGSKLENAITTFAKYWAENKSVEAEFLTYVIENISYPWTMIDKITPRPARSVINMLTDIGFEDTEIIITTKNTYIASFVNAEQPQYLVIEDNFKNGRLPLDKGGIMFADKETVDKVEKMKVCTCLNPLHTALAIYGCLLSYTKISDEMKDSELVKLIENIGYTEGLPVVVNPGIISPKNFIDEVMKVRLPNPFMPDTPQRIVCDTSQKLGIRFGETIKAYVQNPELNVKSLTFIPLAIAGWCRYLMAIDDEGNSFELSPDPMLSSLTKMMADIKIGKMGNVPDTLIKILSNKAIFGVDLYEVGIGEKIEGYFMELIQGNGAIRATLKKYCNSKI